MDYLTIEDPRSDKDVNILIIANHFSFYVQVIITSSQTAEVTAKALWDNDIVHYGLPTSLVLDQGRNL